MKIRHILLVLATAAGGLLATPATALADESVQVRLRQLNNSGASGAATLTATADGRLKVVIQAAGLVPNAPHAQHLHGSTEGLNFHCPDASADRDGNGYVSTEEGMPAYGDIFLSLTTTGDTSRASGLAVDRMPVADARGELRYERVIAAAELPRGTLDHLKDLHVVQHGIDVNGNREYDLGGLGESTMAKAAGLDGIPQELTDPATCGMVSGAAAGSVPVGGVPTGDGSARASASTGYAAGGLAVLGALGAYVISRRRGLLPARAKR